MNTTKVLLAGAILLALGASPAMGGADSRGRHPGDPDSYRISFTKCFGSPVPAPYIYWMPGSVAGDVVGTLHVGGYDLHPVGTLHTFLEADYIVVAGAQSFIARLGGRLINATGDAEMSGFRERRLAGGRAGHQQAPRHWTGLLRRHPADRPAVGSRPRLNSGYRCSLHRRASAVEGCTEPRGSMLVHVQDPIRSPVGSRPRCIRGARGRSALPLRGDAGARTRLCRWCHRRSGWNRQVLAAARDRRFASQGISPPAARLSRYRAYRARRAHRDHATAGRRRGAHGPGITVEVAFRRWTSCRHHAGQLRDLRPG